MVQWYERVSEKLRQDALQEEVRHQHATDSTQASVPRTSTELSSEDSSADERNAAAEYFRDPLYRNTHGRPAAIRRYSKQAPRSPREFVAERGREIASKVRHLNPWSSGNGRRRSVPDKHPATDIDYDSGDDDDDDDDVADDKPTPTASHPHRYSHHHTRRPPRRESFSSTESEDLSPNQRQRLSPHTVRRHRSHELPASPQEYFPPYSDASPSGRRRYSAIDPRTTTYPNSYFPINKQTSGYSAATASAAVASGAYVPKSVTSRPVSSEYGPSNGQLFATKVAHATQTQVSARPALTKRNSSSYRRKHARDRFDSQERGSDPPPIIREPTNAGTQDDYDHSSRSRRGSIDLRDRPERERSREAERPRMHRYVNATAPPVDGGVGGRRYAVEAPWR
jgi:hypothetical protein